ncbi:E3 ubiquitin-protein ligase SINAT3-like [Folsomia candida]|uniref:E3 ubiquitin-protein ligase SINAT3-like n=1 Tax=Folsomia candida TaxID=158441 RepID=UPI001604C324|nr:E3 ubiquitin-protein ligase SINAT3-like [Folsomia candida]
MGLQTIPVSTTPIEVASLDISLDLVELLQCPVCLELRKPPIFQCVEGHNVCQTCRPKLKNKCPVCRGRMPPGLRNRGLEVVYNHALFFCCNKDYGCQTLVRGDQFETHLELCPHRQVMCKFMNDICQCSLYESTKSHSFQDIEIHLRNGHGISEYNSGQYCSHEESLQFDGDIPLAFWKYDDQIFLEQISIRDNIIYSNIIAMPMKGDEKPDQLETEKLFVEMQLIKKGFDCAPNIRKAIHPMCVCSFGGNTEDQALVYTEYDFKNSVAQINPFTSKFCWISRIDFKLIR